MAAVTQQMYSCPDASVSVTFDNVTGAISLISWTVTAGTLTVTIKRLGQPDLVRSQTTSGSVAVPNGYNLTQSSKGDWRWAGDPSFEIQWLR